MLPHAKLGGNTKRKDTIYHSKDRLVLNKKSLDNQHQMFTLSLSENRGNPAFCEEKNTSTVEEFVPLPAELTKKISVRSDIFYSSSQEYTTYLSANKSEGDRFLKKVKCKLCNRSFVYKSSFDIHRRLIVENINLNPLNSKKLISVINTIK